MDVRHGLMEELLTYQSLMIEVKGPARVGNGNPISRVPVQI